MMKKNTLSLVIALTLLTFTQMVAQETSLPKFKTYAFLVGVSDYAHHDYLVNPVIDVKAVEEELREIYKCETKMLLNPTRRKFLEALHKWAEKRYGPNDQLLVFFSGHGWFDEKIKRGYLAFKDSKPSKDDTIYDSYVSHEDVRVILERLDCKHVLLIMDPVSGERLTRRLQWQTREEPLMIPINLCRGLNTLSANSNIKRVVTSLPGVRSSSPMDAPVSTAPLRGEYSNRSAPSAATMLS